MRMLGVYLTIVRVRILRYLCRTLHLPLLLHPVQRLKLSKSGHVYQLKGKGKGFWKQKALKDLSLEELGKKNAVLMEDIRMRQTALERPAPSPPGMVTVKQAVAGLGVISGARPRKLSDAESFARCRHVPAGRSEARLQEIAQKVLGTSTFGRTRAYMERRAQIERDDFLREELKERTEEKERAHEMASLAWRSRTQGPPEDPKPCGVATMASSWHQRILADQAPYKGRQGIEVSTEYRLGIRPDSWHAVTAGVSIDKLHKLVEARLEEDGLGYKFVQGHLVLTWWTGETRPENR